MHLSEEDQVYVRHGISAKGLRHVLDHLLSPEQRESFTTSDVCHALLKPLTAADGWECIPFLTDAEKRWYRHDYRSHATGETIHCGFGQPGVPPPGSRSYCEASAPSPPVYPGTLARRERAAEASICP